MRRSTKYFVLSTVISMAVVSMLLSRPFAEPVAQASSHREAPLISQDQLADNTDVYAFRSPDLPNMLTVLANFIPGQEPAEGPNFFSFDDNVLYQIRLDNNGDALVDLVLEFRFRTETTNPDTFLYNTNQVTSLSDPDLVVRQFYSVTARVRQGAASAPTFTTFVLGTNIPVPPVNVGVRSTPNYETALAEPAITTIAAGPSNIRVFAGQRDEGFYLDVGSVFDLLGLRPLNSAHLVPLANDTGRDRLARFNVHTIAMQIPISLLTATATQPTVATDPNAILGFYATASRPSTRVLGGNGTGTVTVPNDCANGQGIPGASANCVQVSRLANPLFNELLMPRGTSPTVSENDRDRYNAELPLSDINRIDFVRGTATRGVEPVALINLLYPPVNDAPTSGRNDLVRVFLTGVPGATRPPVVIDPADPTAGPGAVPADLLRVNVAVPVTAAPNRLGVIGGDMQGYPNGRRPADDVIDITLRVAAGVLLPGTACAGGTVNCNSAPNNALGDGVDANEVPFRTTFPYLAAPTNGYDTIHFQTTGSGTP